MTTKQLHKLNMYLAAQDICEEYSSVWELFPTFAAAYADLKIRIVNILLVAKDPDDKIIAPTPDRKTARLKMCILTLNVAKSIHANAVKNKDRAVAAEVDFSMADLADLRGMRSVTRCEKILALAKNHLAPFAPDQVAAAEVNALEAAIAGYVQALDEAHPNRLSPFSIPGQLTVEFAAADEDLAQLDDEIGQMANADFIREYTYARLLADKVAHDVVLPREQRARLQRLHDYSLAA